MNLFKWQKGRQGTGYDKMLLATLPWPIPFDCYLLRYPDGSEIPPHRDPVAKGKHFRLNVILKQSKGGQFTCENPIFESKRVKFFRPDLSLHSVTKVKGTRYVFSFGWLF
jgi:hypothetical protein